MSVKLAAEEIERFISTSEPEIMCVTGEWGVGKTYTWNHYLNLATQKNNVALRKYSYVSLFGVNSLEEVKFSIFENSKKLKINYIDYILSYFSFGKWNSWRKVYKFVGEIPKIKDYKSIFPTFSLVSNQIICIDDLERCGADLTMNDIFGLALFLKEQRKCKVVVLLNYEMLTEHNRKDFDLQLEKVFDIDIKFEPTTIEAIQIAVNDTKSFSKDFKSICISLNIKNIRIIKKIERILDKLEIILKDNSQKVFVGWLPSVVLLGWSFYQPNVAPDLNYIKNFNHYNFLRDSKTKENEVEKRWRLQLSSINFTHFDEVDNLILEAIKCGYFDTKAIKDKADEFDKSISIENYGNTFGEAWNKFDESFLGEKEEILTNIKESLKKGVQAVTPNDLDATVRLFRKFDKDEEAEEMIDFYINERKESKNFYNTQSLLLSELSDPNLIKAFNNKFLSFKDNRDPKSLLIDIAKNGGWNEDDLKRLSEVTVENYYSIIKNSEGRELRTIISQALQFGKYANASDEMKKITTTFENALIKIGQESDLNRQRVKRYGIDLN